MVTRLLFFFCLCFMPLVAEVSVYVQVTKAVENEPVEGIITITQSDQDPIDVKSFTLDNKPLQVEFVKKADNISTYKFTTVTNPKGLFLIPPISVKVGDKTYNSFALAYEVTSTSAPSGFRLEALVTPSLKAYPGQKLTFTYKIFYQDSVNLTEEKLPLLDATGFQKIGQKEIRDLIENQSNVQVISQKVKALKPGLYKFPGSIVAGTAYIRDELGKPVAVKSAVRSETPPLTIEILPFPEKGQPFSFDGALGKYIMQVKLISNPKVTIGDEMILSIEISGKAEDLDTVTLPNLACQPGFSGFFRLNDLPPSEETTETTKNFQVSLRPINTLISAIPKIEFSSFVPETEQYLVLQSKPIPISIQKISVPLPSPQKETEVDWRPIWEQEMPKEKEWNQKLTELFEDSSQSWQKYYEMGNLYSALGEYPWAILFYYRAQELVPHNEAVRHNLLLAQQQLGLPSEPPPTFYSFSLKKLTQLFLIIATALAACGIAMLWYRNALMIRATIFLGTIALLLLFNFVYIRYFSLMEGVVVHSTLLYRGTGTDFPIATTIPVVSGQKVTVLSINEDGQWIKILTPAGNIGYVSYEKLRLI